MTAVAVAILAIMELGDLLIVATAGVVTFETVAILAIMELGDLRKIGWGFSRPLFRRNPRYNGIG